MSGNLHYFRVGRDRAAEIPIADDSVSRLHAQVALAANGVFVTDCNSTNGTYRVRLDGGEETITQGRAGMEEAVKFGSVVISVRDLVQAMHRAVDLRHAAPPPPPPPGQPPLPSAASPVPQALPHSERLVRCVCGAVRSARQPCVLCGE